MTYVALLRGINVGGNSIIKMAELKAHLVESGIENVRTYIQTGNIIFTSDETETAKLAEKIRGLIKAEFGVDSPTVVLSKDQLQTIVESAPKGWGEKPDWKYNTLFLIPPYDSGQIVEAIGTIKPDIESLVVGDGAIYQSLLFVKFGQTTTGKLASMPVYKQMTVRNWNTTRKILGLMDGV